ncbi:MAG: tail protein X [Lachnospiraceae bacterium]|nr:tail protein X [Lachnospiraceae bacterium]
MSDTYTTISGDMWDLVAHKVYGDGMYMDLLLKANIKYKDVYIFSAGITLSVPEINPETAESLPPWKQGAAEYGE